MPPTSQATKSGTRKLSDLAKHLSAPADIASTGWPAVRRTCNLKLGVEFDDWQEGAGRLILAKRADGNLASMIDGVGLSLPRQVGKTYLVGATVFALCVNMPGLLVIWTAHHARTHGETFLAMQGFAKRAKVRPHVAQTFLGSGDEEIRFHNGSRIMFGARERGFGRGVANVDVLIFDEAQILSEKALDGMLATLNRSRFGLCLYIGTPPRPEDNSEAFERMRSDAIEHTLADGAWIEFGADGDADPDDRTQWAKANPSFPAHTPAESMLRLKRKLKMEGFRREGLGIWDDDRYAGPFSLGAWARCESQDDPPKVACLGLALDVDRVWLSLAAASTERRAIAPVRSPDGEPMRVRFDKEGRKLLSECRRIAHEYGVPVALDKGGPAEPLIPVLEDMGVQVVAGGLSDYIKACADVYDAVEAKEIEHPNDPVLNHAVRVAGWRLVNSESGRRVWSRKGGDISMFEAATWALWGSTQSSGGGWAVAL